MELLHAVFTSEASFERNGRRGMSEQARFCEDRVAAGGGWRMADGG